ncbi:MAG: hypothetical protein U0T73_08850 [Chitinophagales bacterium]
MKKKTTAWALLIVGLFVALASCTKEKTATPDDPNIVYVNANRSYPMLPAVLYTDSIDLNNDGLCELKMQYENVAGDTGVVEMGQWHQPLQIAVDGNLPYFYAKVYKSGDAMSTSSAIYQSPVYMSIKASGYRLGLVSGEGYFVFRFSTGTKFQYGWMRVSVSSTYNEFKILDYAYSLLPETPIAVGAK